MMAINTRSRTSKNDRVGTFRDSVPPVWPLWLESRCPASYVEVVAGDLFATSNPFTSQTEKNLLSLFRNIRAITPKLCARSSLAIVVDKFFVAQRCGSGSFNPASMRSRSRSCSGRGRVTRPHRTLKIPILAQVNHAGSSHFLLLSPQTSLK
jgi:hypothetical protein